ESRGTGADDRDLLAGPRGRRLGDDPALFPAAVDDGVLDVLDGHRRRVDAEHARAFTRCRAHAPGEFRKIVGAMQALERLLPQAAVDEVVPLRDEVVHRAARGHARDQFAGVAERHSAIHAARALLSQALLVHVVVELVPVAHALGRGTIHRQLAQIFYETCWLTHLTIHLLLITADARQVARVFLERGHDGLVTRQPLVVGASEAGEHALVILRNHAQELRQLGRPGREDILGVATAGYPGVFLDQRAQFFGFLRVFDAIDLDHLHVDLRRRFIVFVEKVGNAA